MCADECTSRQLRISFARLFLEIDVTKPLVRTIRFEDPSGNMVEQQVVYEWAPPFCKTCNKVGHDCSKKAAAKKKTSKQWVPKATTKDTPTDPEVVVGAQEPEAPKETPQV